MSFSVFQASLFLCCQGSPALHCTAPGLHMHPGVDAGFGMFAAVLLHAYRDRQDVLYIAQVDIIALSGN